MESESASSGSHAHQIRMFPASRAHTSPNTTQVVKTQLGQTAAESESGLVGRLIRPF